jgi:16S rRNA G527 N7-methylase RsmG
MIDQEKKMQKFVEVVQKINKIHDVVSIKQEGLQQRKIAALKHHN